MISGITVDRKNETELPQRVTISYIDATNDYETGTQSALRIQTRSVQNSQSQVPLVMSADEAKQLAEIVLQVAWLGAETIKFSLPIKHLGLEPTDVITLVGNDGSSYELRVMTITVNGLQLDCEGELHDASVSVSNAAADPSTPRPGTVAGAGRAEVFMLDTPPLRDADGSRPTMYVGMRGQTRSWSGSILFTSPDDQTFTEVLTYTSTSLVCGYTTSVLGDFFGKNLFLDRVNSVTVQVFGGTLTSISYSNMIADRTKNCAYFNGEIVQFMTATLVGTNTYALSGFLRGKQGTEAKIPTHYVGEDFVLLNTQIVPFGVSLDRYLQPLYYKAPAFNSSLDNADAGLVVPQNMAIAPFALANPATARDVPTGDFWYKWIRRARVYNEWTNGIEVPVDSTAEQYTVRIDTANAYINTYTVSTPAFVYTTALMVADGIQVGTQFTVTIRQINNFNMVSAPLTFTQTRV